MRELKTDRVLGPGGGGCILSVAINPHDQNNIFASSDMSSNYISVDGGLSWKQPYRFRNVVADWFFSADPNTVYALTLWHTFVSKNKGKTWTPLWPGTTEFNMRGSDGYLNTSWADISNNTYTFRSLLEDPEDPNVIYILTNNGRIARSTNGGMSFSVIPGSNLSYNNGSYSGFLFARLQIDPTTTLLNRKLTMLALSGVYAFDVTNGSWTTRKIFTELTSTSGTLPPEAVTNAGQIVIDGKNTLLYLKRVSSLNNFETELVVSSDFGITWKNISTSIQDAFTPSPTGSNAIRLGNFTVANKDIIYLSAKVSGTDRLLKTIDGGTTWSVLITSGASPSLITNPGWYENRYGTLGTGLNSDLGLLGERTYNSMASTPAYPNICLSGTIWNVLATVDGGAKWSQLNTNLANPQPTLPAVAPPSSTQSNGAFRFYQTRGMDQTNSNSIHIDPFNPNHQFICFDDIGLWETYDDGDSWRSASQAMTINSQDMGNCHAVSFDPNKQNRVYSVWCGVVNDAPMMSQTGLYNAYNNPARAVGGAYYSTNGGYIYTRSSGIPTTGIQGLGITVDPQSGKGNANSIVYSAIAGYEDVGGIYRSTDGGVSYSRFMKGVAARDLAPFSLEWNADASRLYVSFLPIHHTTAFAKAFPNYNYDGDSAGAYYMDRGTDTWKPITFPSTVYAVNRFSCDPFNPDVVYIAARRRGSVPYPQDDPRNGGIYVSKDAGKTWRLISVSSTNTTAVAISSFNPDRIYFAESRYHYNGGMIYYSDKGTETQTNDWKPINFDLQYTVLNNVQQDPQDPNALYIGTYGAGMWHLMVDKQFESPDTYAVNVISEGVGATGNGEYYAGMTVSIFAGTPPVGQRFKTWTTTNNDVNFSNAKNANTRFVMPESNVTAMAVFEDGSSDPGDIPIFFTPNGDGINDTWDIPSINENPEAVIKIYNRSKKLIVELKGAQMPWDGRDNNGKLVESGYYFFQINLQQGNDKLITGYLTVLR